MDLVYGTPVPAGFTELVLGAGRPAAAALARQRLGEDPFGGALFVFAHKERKLLKILFWEGSGVWVLARW